jgi:hypothetical protein
MAKLDGTAGAEAVAERYVPSPERFASAGSRLIVVVRKNTPPNLHEFHFPDAWQIRRTLLQRPSLDCVRVVHVGFDADPVPLREELKHRPDEEVVLRGELCRNGVW